MKTIVKEIEVRTALTKTGIPGRKYCINPYTGCVHACRYCYATFMKRFTGHMEPWGSFVDVKINAPEVLRRELKKAEKGGIIISSVTDPYQPAEAKYMITRKCLQILMLFKFPVDILTKSPLILRDVDIISKIKDAEAGITITTEDDRIKNIFEMQTSTFHARVEALKKLHETGIRTYVFIGPILPMNPELLAEKIKPYVYSVIIDRMNYSHKVKWIYEKYHMEKWLDEGFTNDIILRLRNSFSGKEVEVC